MDRGTYISASSGLLQLRKLDIVNNNLANANTPGFKGQLLVSEQQSFDDTLAKMFENADPYARGDHNRTPGVVNIKAVTDFTPGPIKNTSNPFDVALRNPKDFLVVNTTEGTQYTRAGNLSLNAEGEITTADGQVVQGDGGALVVNGANVEITAAGIVRVDGEQIGKLQVVRFDNTENLERVSGARFQVRAGSPGPEEVDADLIPKSLEMSNVSAISSVVDLITANRAFGLYTKAATTIDQMNQSSIQEIGKRR